MQLSQIPIKSLPNQKLKVEVVFDGKKQTFNLEFNYRDFCGYWTMTVKDSYRNTLLSNIPLVCGEGLLNAGDLFAQFKYMNLGSFVCAKVYKSDLDIPDQTTLGSIFQLGWGDSEISYNDNGTVGGEEE